MDSVFKSTEPEPKTVYESPKEELEPNKYGASEGGEPLEGVHADEAVLSVLGIADSVKNLPEDDKKDLHEVRNYLDELMQKKGVMPTEATYKRFLDTVQEQFGIDKDAEPDIVLGRISGIIKAWRGISFVVDPTERKQLFAKLIKLENTKDMDEFVFSEMNRKKVWQ